MAPVPEVQPFAVLLAAEPVGGECDRGRIVQRQKLHGARAVQDTGYCCSPASGSDRPGTVWRLNDGADHGNRFVMRLLMLGRHKRDWQGKRPLTRAPPPP